MTPDRAPPRTREPAGAPEIPANAGGRYPPHDAYPYPGAAPAEAPTLAGVLRALWRRRRFLVLWTLGFLALAVLAIRQFQPMYRADALVMLDTRQLHFADMRAVLTGPMNQMDPNIVRTEVAVLTSDGMARRVVADLGLADRPEFAPRPPTSVHLLEGAAGALRWVAAHTGLPAEDFAASLEAEARGLWTMPDEPTRFAIAVARYRGRLSATNDGRSYVITLGFRSPDPELAARVANRHAELYVEDQRRMKHDALNSASAWLDREVSALAERLRRAEAAVQQFRERHQLFYTQPDGPLIAAQRLAEANTQLAAARADLAQREARLARARRVAASEPGAIEAETDVTGSATISRLRDQEATAARRFAELSDLYGPRHPSVRAVAAELAQVRARIQDEAAKIVRGLESEAAIARSREAELRRIFADLERQLGTVEGNQARARDLEREASALRSLYESLLARQKQVATQEGIQQADARIASRAAEPLAPYFPDSRLFLAAALMGAVTSGAGLALLRERMRPGFANLTELEAALGVRGLASVPEVARRKADGRRLRLPHRRGNALAAEVVDRPKSMAAEAIRTLRRMLALSAGPGTAPPRTIAVMSALPGEGKTSMAFALARSLSRSGLAVLLVDGDLHRPSLARAMVETATPARAPEPELQNLDTLTVTAGREGSAALSDSLGPGQLRELIAARAQAYDYVILDTPPLAVASDALVIGCCVEAVVLVARWERTPRDAVAGALRSLREVDIPVIGAVLNGVHPGSVAEAGGYGPGAGSATRKYRRA